MLAKVQSVALVGLDAHLIDVEVDIAGGLPQFSVVGLPDATVRESRDRVRSALKNTGFHFPAKKITVNLAPADIKKEGAGLDLAIAIGILVAEEVISQQSLDHRVLVASCRWMVKSNRSLEPSQSASPVAGSTVSCYPQKIATRRRWSKVW
ncbi:MAG TPA: magnesium chelatase domain-containing protein [Nitrospira sp.]|nr:magnesium chelatase domain-containing protein [Nitrospira sp.]